MLNDCAVARNSVTKSFRPASISPALAGAPVPARLLAAVVTVATILDMPEPITL